LNDIGKQMSKLVNSMQRKTLNVTYFAFNTLHGKK